MIADIQTMGEAAVEEEPEPEAEDNEARFSARSPFHPPSPFL